MSGSDLPTSDSSVSPPLIDLHVVAAVILRDGHILAAKRLEGGPSGLKWEFPGGKVESGETPRAALQREILEELGLEVTVGDELGTFPTALGKYCIHLNCFWCRSDTGSPQLNAHSAVTWLAPHELNSLDWALPDIPAIQAIQKHVF